MNDSEKQRKRKIKFTILPRGWRFIIISLLASIFTYSWFISDLKANWTIAHERRLYDEESTKTLKVDCKIMDVKKTFSKTDKYSTPIFETNLNGDGRNFRQCFKDYPGNIGEIKTLNVKKEVFMGKKPEYSDGGLNFFLIPLCHMLFVSLIAVLTELVVLVIADNEEGCMDSCIRNRETGQEIRSCRPGITILLSPPLLMFPIGFIYWIIIWIAL